MDISYGTHKSRNNIIWQSTIVTRYSQPDKRLKYPKYEFKRGHKVLTSQNTKFLLRHYYVIGRLNAIDWKYVGVICPRQT
jgi:hypothetical protein